MHDIDNHSEVNLDNYEVETEEHEYIDELSRIDSSDAAKFLDVGVDTKEMARAGTFIQKDKSVIHCRTKLDGVEVMGISQAREKYEWLGDYMWKSISPDTDKFTSQAKEKPHEGYFIRSLPGVKTEHPIQACLYIAKDKFSQNVHNVVIAEEGSELHIITGCATAPHLVSGLHVGVSEFYVKKGAKLIFTMIHDWGEKVNVRPRTVTQVDEGGLIISNYISLKPVGSLQMFPTTYLNGRGAVARFNSILVASKGSYLDVGSKVVLSAPDSRAEIISRAITSGGTIIARGSLIGKVAGIKAHLECKGLILNDGLMHAIPELQAYVPNVEMSHEAAVGKIDQHEIEYLMARGLDEDEAVSTIVRGFLNVDIEGLPENLKNKLDNIIAETQKDMM
ncbi:MAG: SufD family Fe-S cluster assembly protein [Proteobacteria bacterium]|nr:SufD family Fe-S cluster assembly protein [Pseudomonadota bacterium]MBU4208245.1 SufD family Fe-S cluster assembly protein [Pseudomonadota bacterium]MBU4388323.1 SufD family Fe-S cluster assembly protein [Pseudomonadota bacterium]MBU4504081.1 SufD family Fe-S cluster assembly protein [Pseudomonadota bacterium]